MRAHDGNQQAATTKPGRTARLAAHAVGPAARPARSVARRHRDRGHRARAGARCALERADGRRSRLLGGPARARRGADRRGPAARHGSPLAAGRAAARCTGIRDRRPHQPVQGRRRPRLQGLRGAAAASHPSPFRLAADLAGRRRRPASSTPTASPPTTRQRCLRASAWRKRAASSASPATFPRTLQQTLGSLSAQSAAAAQAAFLERFNALVGK